MAEVEVGRSLAKRVRNGYQPTWNELTAGLNSLGYEKGYIKLVEKDNLVAVLRVDKKEGPGNGMIKIERVFS